MMSFTRHAERVSASMHPVVKTVPMAKWILKQVQGDEFLVGSVAL